MVYGLSDVCKSDCYMQGVVYCFSPIIVLYFQVDK